MNNKLSTYFDFKFFTLFVSLYGFLYFFNMYYVGLVSAGGKIYSPFLDHHVNYVAWITRAILYTSNLITNLFGFKTFVSLPYQIKMFNGSSLQVMFPCIGLLNMSFWIAFVISHRSTIKMKALWCMAGIIAIFIINCCRITLLSIVLCMNANVNKFGEHHDIFNNVAYVLIGCMVYIYYAVNKKKNRNSNRIQ